MNDLGMQYWFDLIPVLLQNVTVLGVCCVRLFIIMTLFPPTADGVMKGAIRNGTVLMFCAFIALGQPASFAAALHGTYLIEVGLREAMIGLVFGFAASTVFWVAEAAGTYVDYLAGYNNAQITNPLRNEQATPSGTLLSQLAIVSFWTLGGMTFLLGALYDSYRWWPITGEVVPVSRDFLAAFAMRQTDTLMQTVAKLAAPMLFILLLVDVGFGIASKSAQKLELNSLSQPVKGAVTVLLLALLVGVFAGQVRDQLSLRDLAISLQTMSHAKR